MSAHARMLYRALCREGAMDAARVEHLLGQRLAATGPLNELRSLGLVRQADHGLVEVPRRQAIDTLLAEQSRSLTLALQQALEHQQHIETLSTEADDLDIGATEVIRTVSLPDRTTQDGLYTVAAPAHRELKAIHPGGQFSPEVLRRSVLHARTNLDAGIRLRVIHQASALAHPASVDYLATIEEMGGSVRIRENLPFRILIVDRRTAVCGPGNAAEDDDTYLLHGQRVMTLLDRMFETTWVDATPLRTCLAGSAVTPATAPRRGSAGDAESGTSGLTPQQRTILRLLAEGETDQSIARQLGVTSRTVTRRIAEIYATLKVDSRFQAGAAAHRLGLV